LNVEIQNICLVSYLFIYLKTHETCWKSVLNIKCVLFFSSIFVCNIFHSNKYLTSYTRDTCINRCRSTYGAIIIAGQLFIEVIKYRSSWRSVEQFLGCFRHTDWWNEQTLHRVWKLLELCARISHKPVNPLTDIQEYIILMKRTYQ
jgi:hypothetical protein